MTPDPKRRDWIWGWKSSAGLPSRDALAATRSFEPLRICTGQGSPPPFARRLSAGSTTGTLH
ncbi:hypothetical protein EJ04DRAFT_516741 [Polyplosphaeria fusca]|uniref:Uncharacterized protein n=1 Tax=Polyplosphaeria fusca TaxID=682080 RepID=A0A9P4QKZ9_9PLEO|nr:hypothetical protein EJ04DRAFT_516741 [Polyplosphaeria fusca]